MSRHALQFEQVSFHYRNAQQKAGTYILQELSFAIQEGEFVTFLGPSGVGKSTIFRLITGLEQPTSGRILINGVEAEQRLGEVGYMPQQDLLMPWRTILQNAGLPLELKGKSRLEASRVVSQHLAEFGLAGVESKYPRELSGGMRQRVSFLRAILGETKHLLLDEPFSALDSLTRLAMQEWLLERWEKWKKTIIFITHDVEEALFLSDRIFVLQERPITSIVEVQVPLSRPRSIRDMSQTQMLELKLHLIEQLRGLMKL